MKLEEGWNINSESEIDVKFPFLSITFLVLFCSNSHGVMLLFTVRASVLRSVNRNNSKHQFKNEDIVPVSTLLVWNTWSSAHKSSPPGAAGIQCVAQAHISFRNVW